MQLSLVGAAIDARIILFIAIIQMQKGFEERLRQLGRLPTEQTLDLENTRLGGKYLIFDLLSVGQYSIIYYGIEQSSREERIFKHYNFKEIEQMRGFKEKQLCKRFTNYQYTLIRKCNSPHVLKLYDMYQDRNGKIVVSEYCNLGSLKREIKSRKSEFCNQMIAIAILKQVVNGLRSFHRGCQYLHKNLKAEEIMIQDGIYKLSSIGYPYEVKESEKGVSDFHIPEIVMKKSYDEKAEVWSVGVLFHQILFGRIPQALVYNSKYYLISPTVTTIFEKKQSDFDLMPDVRQFLKRCLFTDPDQRMSWSELENHPMFDFIKVKEDVQSMKKKPSKVSNNRHISVILAISQEDSVAAEVENMPSIQQSNQFNIQTYEEPLRNDFYQSKHNLELELKTLQKQLQRPYERFGQPLDIQKLQPVSWSPLRQYVKKESHQTYQQILSFYLNCLKVDFVYNQIIRVLLRIPQFSKERVLIQFAYLLLTRCFFELSELQALMQRKQCRKGSKGILMACIKRQTREIYQQVVKQWENYSRKLVEEESKVFQVFKDKLKSFINEKEEAKQNRFFVGIEKIDYTKQQQIAKTIDLYQKQLKYRLHQLLKPILKPPSSLILGPNQKQNGFSIIKYLEHYQQIWNIQILPEGQMDFKLEVESVIDKRKRQK